ncbi:putative tail assembly chaperone [Mycobacterium phage PP]|uniref:Putative tail assembly chaperone n=1 Tax=Mycobacterium phage PP TaxID=2077134 RepID=A0A2Z5XVG8_9CAUD|nr:tail assembly chaperone [Mycobacterium phage PP]BBC53827.1 putative tail assembly chaperone [Mycobacterium phage PP]
MSNVFTLDALRDEARKKFAPVKIGLSDDTEVELTSLLKLSREDRKTVKAALDAISELEDDEDNDSTVDDLIDLLEKIYTVVASKPAKLLRAFEDDDREVKLAMMFRVLSAWLEQAQVGEA